MLQCIQKWYVDLKLFKDLHKLSKLSFPADVASICQEKGLEEHMVSPLVTSALVSPLPVTLSLFQISPHEHDPFC